MIRCKLCGDIIESRSVHDFRRCSCGACFVDGGREYRRIGAKSMDDVEDLSICRDAVVSIMSPFDFEKNFIANPGGLSIKECFEDSSGRKWLLYKSNAVNNCIGSKLAEFCGIPAQEAAMFRKDYNMAWHCACEWLPGPDRELWTFASVRTLVSKNPFSREIDDVLDDLSRLGDFEDNFWEMFILDALSGNGLRSDWRWGFIAGKTADGFGITGFAPLFGNIGAFSILPENNKMNAFIDMDYSCFEDKGLSEVWPVIKSREGAKKAGRKILEKIERRKFVWLMRELADRQIISKEHGKKCFKLLMARLARLEKTI